jgi:integrase
MIAQPNETKPRRKARAESWPKIIRAEGCRVGVKVYRRTRASGKVGFQVANYANGGRLLESFEGEQDAIERAEDLSRMQSNSRVLAAELTNVEAVSFQACSDLLAPHGLALLPTIQTAVEAFKLTGSLSAIIKAAEDYARRHGVNVTPKSIAEAVPEYVTERKASGCAQRYLQDLKSRLGRFAKAFKIDVSGVTGDAIQTWLDGMKNLSPQSRINYRRVLSSFFGFCERRGYLPKGWDELERLAPIKVRNRNAVAIYTPDELQSLLVNAPASFAPALAIQAFCGLRSAEVERLRWEDVNMAQGHVTVGAHASKTASRRIVPLCDAARDWLALHAKASGAVWNGAHRAFYQAQQSTADAAGLEWKHNALRHSFCSYRLAQTGDAALTSFEAGNSATMVHRHYKELVTAADGNAWFAVTPPKSAGKIVPLVAQTA